jgi:sulfide:quinone oxidoreductase
MFAKPKVVVLGGGFGGLESAFYLRHVLGDRIDLTLVSDSRYFTFKPNTIYIPFGEDPEKSRTALLPAMKRKNIHFVHGIALEIEPVARRVETSHGPIFYDYLIVATGAGMHPEEIPGFRENVHTLWTTQQLLRVGDGLERLVDAAKSGSRQRLMFLAPPKHPCLAPLYEMALMTDTWLREKGVRDNVEFTWATAEHKYFQAFGPRMHHVVEDEFDRREIDGLTGLKVSGVEPGRVLFHNKCSLGYDFLIGAAPYIAMQRYPSLAENQRGFLEVDPDSRRVKFQDRVFAVGDTADFPLKQAYLALLQADAAADHIAAEILGTQPKIDFHPVNLYVMEQFNKAAFVQAPLKYTASGSGQVEVDPEAAHEYQVGVSPLWRVGKKVMGVYLPWRFGHGEPFHAGLAWNAINAGLKMAKSVLAS